LPALDHHVVTNIVQARYDSSSAVAGSSDFFEVPNDLLKCDYSY